jgi:hypothetical protein
MQDRYVFWSMVSDDIIFVFDMCPSHTGCNRVKYTNLEIYCGETDRNFATQFVRGHLVALQVFFTSVQ